MPRKPRVFALDVAYHVIARGNNRAALFVEPSDYATFLGYLKFFKTQYVFDLFHYCLMTNHVHLLMRFPDRETFQKVPQVKDNRYLMECGRYIERNPVNARMMGVAADHRWSNFHFYGMGESDPLLTPNPTFLDLAGDDAARREKYRHFINVERPYEDAVEAALFGRAIWRPKGKVSP